jgi:hypothetical protein
MLSLARRTGGDPALEQLKLFVEHDMANLFPAHGPDRERILAEEKELLHDFLTVYAHVETR